MTEEIKARIEQIKAGKVPEGYIKTRAGLMPSSDDIRIKSMMIHWKYWQQRKKTGLFQEVRLT